MKNFDCVVIGGGMIGAASAVALANLGLKIALVELSPCHEFSAQSSFDLRVSAISVATQQLLEQLDAWHSLSQKRLCPYSRLGVWETELSYTEFDAQKIEQPILGHIVENKLIQLSLWEVVSSNNNITTFCPDTLKAFTQNTEQVIVELESQTITAKLLVAADGANSKVRTLANIGVTGWDYNQSAMLINVETQLPQQNITWQQFYETGPVAMLPLSGESELGGYASLVWYHQKSEIKRLSSLSNHQLEEQIMDNFPTRLGKIKVIDKGAFPLTRKHANSYQKGRVLLLGDSAHTINPMAGQGVNIGFKDVKALQQIVAKAIGNGESWSDIHVLARYEKQRRNDNLMMMTTMDMLYSSFSHPSTIVKVARNIGLMLANHSGAIKNKALAYACGL
ncbi:FAD-dependent monooxygenase [Pseudocolwellia sp. AS88]|uniref:FAD-dependent monooxygenase n=1 Tax=Pseudocolwellia sp. AS88 TaxID=3063958 RepID=UPI0026EB4797|nr:FAD-dependent monooxygenase [Pseudocolwellia sp. AS88]MDO7086423.1 FAD-dependent oxidoreductase [Pseudocolwellia sp. AS88]